MRKLPWQAPRTAYLLTAAAAEADTAACDALWDPLDDGAQADVLAALGAQARLALTTGLTALGSRSAGLDVSALAAKACIPAVDAFRALLAGEAWELPECSHCRQILAAALATSAAQIAGAQGISVEVFAHSCRETAAQVART